MPQPPEQEAEVVCEIIEAHSVILLKVADEGLDGRAPSYVTFDLRGDAALLAGGVDFEFRSLPEPCVLDRSISPIRRLLPIAQWKLSLSS